MSRTRQRGEPGEDPEIVEGSGVERGQGGEVSGARPADTDLDGAEELAGDAESRGGLRLGEVSGGAESVEAIAEATVGARPDGGTEHGAGRHGAEVLLGGREERTAQGRLPEGTGVVPVC